MSLAVSLYFAVVIGVAIGFFAYKKTGWKRITGLIVCMLITGGLVSHIMDTVDKLCH